MLKSSNSVDRPENIVNHQSGASGDEEALTPLQQAASERIAFFQEELKKRGFFVHLGFEQEFLIENDGQPATNVLVRDDAPPSQDPLHDEHYTNIAAWLKQAGNRFIDGVCSEYATIDSGEAADKNEQLMVYEAKFTNYKKDGTRKGMPLELTEDLHRFRSQTLKQLLQSETSLQSPWFNRQLEAVMRPIPYPDHPRFGDDTIGLHANLSVCVTRRAENCLKTLSSPECVPVRCLKCRIRPALAFCRTMRVLRV